MYVKKLENFFDVFQVIDREKYKGRHIDLELNMR